MAAAGLQAPTGPALRRATSAAPSNAAALSLSNQAQFSIMAPEKPLIAAWLRDTGAFFSSHTQAVESLSYAFSTEGGGSGMLYAAAGIEVLTNDANGANPDSSSTTAAMREDNAVEARAVHEAVRLVAVLANTEDVVRSGAVLLLVQLASILAARLGPAQAQAMRDDSRVGVILLGIMLDDRELYNSVHELFKMIGPSLAPMAIPLVAGLEAFFTCLDPNIRGICITALTRVVFENGKIFLEEDHLAAVWNLYFSFGSIASITKVFPDRIVLIKGLGLLAPIYAAFDSSLTYGIISTLLNLDAKTVLETEEIKATVKQLVERIPELEQKTPGPHDLHAYGTGFNFFLNLLTPTNESSYDLLPWTLETFTNIMYYSIPANKTKAIPIAGASEQFEALEEFVKSLSNHFRASPPLVRYGASAALHTSLLQHPRLVDLQPSLLTFILTGCLDTDPLAAFLYLTILEGICTGGAQTPVKTKVKELISKLRRTLDAEAVTYDSLFFDADRVASRVSGESFADDAKLRDVLDAAALMAPPIAPKLLQKLVNSFEYLPKTMKLRQLDIVRLWGAKSEKLDANLMQALLPLLSCIDEDIQLSTVRVVKALIPRLNASNSADINYAWSFLQNLMQTKTSAPLLCSILGLIRDFPLDRLGDDTKEELLNSLLKIIFHPNFEVRLHVYDIIGSSGDFWRSSGLWGAAIGMLFLAIGDQNVVCARKVISHICSQIEKVAAMKELLIPLGLVKDSLSKSIVHTIKAYDDLANAILKDKSKLTDLLESMTLETNADAFWGFYLEGVTDSQLVRPDDYDYTRNFIHAPFWISIVLTKLSMTPPPVTESESDSRDVMPTTPANKRRFICGFMLCLLPTCGMPDPIFRHAACVAAVFTGFRQNVAHPGILRGLLEFVSTQMLNHKMWAYQLSGLDILTLLVRVKLTGLSPAVLIQFLDMALDVAFNSPSHAVKIGAVELIETFLLVFPNGVSAKLPDIRDVLRTLLTNEEPEVSRAACRIYPLVFHCVSANNAKDFHEYVSSEINLIKKGGAELASDPLLSTLSSDELSRVAVCSILSLGSFPVASIAYAIVQELLKHLTSESHDVRYAAFVSIRNQIQHLDSIETATIMWILLPLYADPYKPIRVAFAKFLRKLPSKLEIMLRVISPHTDDSFIMNNVTWEELLLDGVSIHTNMKLLSDVIADLGELNSTNPDVTDQLPSEDDGFNLPRISQKLMTRMKEIAKTYTTMLPSMNISQVVYHLMAMQSSKHMQGYALLVLSEFCCSYESIVTESLDILVSSLAHDLSADKTHLIQAAALGLKNISEFSPPAFKQMLTKVTSAAVPNEGELFNLFYRIDAIRDFSANKAPELLRKYTPIITSHRFSLNKRLYSIYVCVELSLMVGQDDIMRVLDALQGFIETCTEDDVVERIHGSISKLLGVVGPKHTIFRTMLGKCRKYIKSKDVHLRLKSLQIFQIFIKYLSPDEAMNFGCTFLADSNAEVRSKSKQVLVLSGMLDFASASLKNAKSFAGTQRGRLLETCKLPSISKIGVTTASTTENSNELSVPLPDKDPFNTKYYASDRRKKFTTRYGLDEAKFARNSLPVTPSILETVEESTSAFHQPSAQILSKYQWMLNMDNTTLLHECMKQYPEVAEQVILMHLAQTELLMGIKHATDDDDLNDSVEEAAPDVENEIHILDVFSNLLIAYDGINMEATEGYARRLEEFINTCNEKAMTIREKLYSELESTFYFFNEFVDVPIVSDEQYEALEALKAENQKATLEAVKSGTTDRLSALDMKKVEMDEMLESKSESLRRITILALHATSGFGIYYALSTECTEANLIAALQFLADMLQNEHRGIRITAVEAFLTLSKIQLENTTSTSLTPPLTAVPGAIGTPQQPTLQLTQQRRPDLLRKIQDTVTLFLDKLTEGTEIYRRKADYISLTAQLLTHVSNDAFMVLKVLHLLVRFWRDPDNEVRIMSIKMVRLLGEMGIHQVMECFRGGEEARPALMTELAGLLSNPEYLEKEGLQDLLTWRFSQR
ncbi:hypothetical protein HDU78_001407 [Chytriomyces hyalinus]|nr:hypothetical protein HDU78_001407 [Chytriomyces hyalinus]